MARTARSVVAALFDLAALIVLAALSVGVSCDDRGASDRPTRSAAVALERAERPPPSAAPPGDGPTERFAFPIVSGWEREAPRTLEHEAEAGFRLGYNKRIDGAPLSLTIYVYTRGLSDIPTGASSALVTQQLDEALTGITTLVERKQAYRSADVQARDTFALGSAPDSPNTQRLVLKLTYLEPSPPTVSSILLTAAKDHFVKIRITQPGTNMREEERALAPLLEAIGESLNE